MSREQSVYHFVKSNYKLLANSQGLFERDIYKSILKAYFGNKLKFKYGIPRDREIGISLVETVVRVQNIQNIQKLQTIIDENPFLRTLNLKADEFNGLMQQNAKLFAIKEEIPSLSGPDNIDKIANIISKEKAQEIDSLIEQKKKEYLSLPSILDYEEIPEPEAIISQPAKTEWWEELNLRTNPFAGPLDGLFQVDKELFDEIIVRTPLIEWATTQLQHEGDSLFHKGFLLGGDFGTGKTTFYDFIAPHLAINRIEPIRLALTDSTSVAHYIQKFERELCVAISKIGRSYGIQDFSRRIDYEDARLFMLEIQSRNILGFFIFIDDLHKHKDVNTVFDFLANLQVIKNTLSREDIKVAFVVAGFPHWRSRIEQDSALTGFFDASEQLILPQVTPELAAQAIEKRLRAYSNNPEKQTIIKRDFLETVFKRVQERLGSTNIGFRPYIQEALTRFSSRNYDILSGYTRVLDDVTVHNIKTLLESDEYFKECIDKLVYGGGIKKKETRELTLRILCEIYLRRYVLEDEPLFLNNKFVFKQLSVTGFIQKFNRDGVLVWRLRSSIQQMNTRIIKEYGLSLEDYLLQVYSTTGIKASAIVEHTIKQDSPICALERESKQWEGMLEPEITLAVANAIQKYKRIIQPLLLISSTKRFPAYSDELVKQISDSIWSMMRVILRYESPLLIDIYGEGRQDGWSLRFRPLEATQHFTNILDNYDYTARDESKLARLVTFANEAFFELCKEFQRSVAISTSAHLKLHELPRKEICEIFTLYDGVFATASGQDFFDSIDAFTGLVENSFRQYLHVSTLLIFGPYHLRIAQYPDNIKKYITRTQNTATTTYEAYNEFENLNRGQYRDLFQGISKKSPFYRLIIEPLVSSWDTQDLTAFFSLFGEINIIVSHLKKISINERKRDIPTFFRLSCRLIASFSARLRSLLLEENTIIEDSTQKRIAFGYVHEENRNQIRFIQPSISNSIPEYHSIYDYTRVVDTRSPDSLFQFPDYKTGDIEIDLLSIEKNRIKTSMDYCELMALLAHYHAKNEVRSMQIYGTNLCIKRLKLHGK